MSQTKVQGEYIFSQREMVAGFTFTEDGKFDFFFSYGAVDRTASGTFTIDKKMIKLQSEKIAGKDFNVISQSKSGTGYSLKFEDPNPVFLDGIRCTFFIGGVTHEEFTDQSGIVNVPYPHCDSIFVLHTLFPDFSTLIKDNKNESNHFVLALNPSLAQVSFKGIDFTIDDDKTISCMHNYFMPIEDIRFKKQ
ncbi:MAG: hypothetical protein ABIN94_01540 [Ferruginibacter sp.]